MPIASRPCRPASISNASVLGIALPRDMLGTERFYTSWMDTAESQEILQFQNHRFADYQADMRQRLHFAKWLAAPLAPLVLWAMRRILKA